MKTYKCDVCGEYGVSDMVYCLPLWMPQASPKDGIIEHSAIFPMQVNLCEECRDKIADLLYENKISIEGRLKI